MDSNRPVVLEGQNGHDLRQGSKRGTTKFKNQVEEDNGQQVIPTGQRSRDPEEVIPKGQKGRSQIAAEEAVNQLIWNQSPLPLNHQHGSTPPLRLGRSDRVHATQQRLPAPLFQAEYSYATSNPRNYVRDADTPSDDDAESTPPRRKGNRKSEAKLPQSETVQAKPKFGFSTCAIIIAIECLIIFLFGVFVTYDAQANAKTKENADGQDLQNFYPFFQDVHVMIFVGFGFLMTFLRKYGFSAVGYNMLIAAIAIQWSILCRGVFNHGPNSIEINIQSLINGDFAAAAVLISFGALLGVTNPLHLVTLCLVEVFLYAVNEHIGAHLFGAIDIGGSMFIHAFGAYFGLALSLTLRRQNNIDTKNEGSSYNSDIFAMIGTVFLWMFWPSFNGIMATGDDQHRAVLNTVLSLSGSCIFSFAASSLMCPENKFSMVHVQNATLAGGVAVGAVADLMIQPFGALVIGSLAGLLSTAGYVYLTPLLQRKIGLHDTCGVHNLHGMPGIMGGFLGVIMAALATEDMYGNSLYLQYPARAPEDISVLVNDLSSIVAGEGRSAQTQALFQLAALFTTIGIASVGGAVTGLLLRIPCFGKVPDEVLFDDTHLWEVPALDDQQKSGESEPGFGNSAPGTTNIQLEPIQKL